jgi:hypothetical protein
MRDVVNKHMGLKFDNVFEPPEGSDLRRGDVAVLRNVLFCDFMTQAGFDMRARRSGTYLSSHPFAMHALHAGDGRASQSHGRGPQGPSGVGG